MAPRRSARRAGSAARDEIAYWLEVAEIRAMADLQAATIALPGNPLDGGLDLEDGRLVFWFRSFDIGYFNRCLGLGIDRPATEDDVDRVLEIFRSDGRDSFSVQVSPFARPAALEWILESRNLLRGRRWAKMWRDTEYIPHELTDLRIERIGIDRHADWERVSLEAFGMPEFIGQGASSVLGRPGWHHYMTFDGDEAVGGAAMYLVDDVAWFGFGATLDAHRGRGSQTALFARRMRDARELGARLLVTETGEDTPDDPNVSYRNMLRAGFRLGYLRQNWLPPEVDLPAEEPLVE